MELKQGDRVRYKGIEAKVNSVDKNFQNLGEPWAYLSWIGQQPSNVGNFLPVRDLELISNGQWVAETAPKPIKLPAKLPVIKRPEPKTEIPREDSFAKVDEAALELLSRLPAMLDTIQAKQEELDKLQSKYTHIRAIALQLAEHDLYPVKISDIPPPLEEVTDGTKRQRRGGRGGHHARMTDERLSEILQSIDGKASDEVALRFGYKSWFSLYGSLYPKKKDQIERLGYRMTSVLVGDRSRNTWTRDASTGSSSTTE